MSSPSRTWLRAAAGLIVAGILLVVVAPPEPAVRDTASSALVSSASYVLLGATAVGALCSPRARAAGRARTWLGIMVIGALAAGEEITWRRTVLGELLRWGPAAALAAATVVFALAHRARPEVHLATGALFGVLYLATGALSTSICAHWSYNLAIHRRSSGHHA